MAIDPLTGLEETDPDNLAIRRQQALDRAAMTHVPAPPVPPVSASTAPAPAAFIAPLRPVTPAAEAPETPRASPVDPGLIPPQQAKPTRQTSGGSQSVSYRQVTKEEKETAGRLRAAEQQEIEATKSEAKIKEEKAAIEARAADEKATREVLKQAATNDAIEQGNKRLADAQARKAAAQEKFDKMQLKDFWADKTTGQKIAGGIAVVLGSLGASLNGGPNYGLQIINNAIERDFALQRAKIDKQKTVVDMANADVEIARISKEDLLRDSQLKQAAAERAAAAQLEATVAQLGPGVAQANGEKTVAQLRQQAEARELKYNESVSKKINNETQWQAVTGGAMGPGNGKPLTVEQGKAADLAGRMLQDSQVISQAGPISSKGLVALRKLAAVEMAVERNPTLAAGLIATGALKTPEQVLSDKDRLAFAAQKRYAASVLRGDSGAAISIGEYLTFGQQHFEQLGDKGRDLEAKKLAREQQIRGKLRAAGPAAEDVVNSVKPLSAAPAGPGAVRQMRTKTGELVTVRQRPDGKWEEVDQVAAR